MAENAGTSTVRISSLLRPHWTALTLGTVGAEFEVVKPPELLAQLREWAGRFSRATGA